MVVRDLMKVSGFSSQSTTPLIRQYIHLGRLQERQHTVRGFARCYIDEDAVLLAEMDCLQDTPNGLAVKKL